MRYNALLKLHQRQVDILDMIVSCSNRIAEGKRNLDRLKEDENSYTKDAFARYWNQFIGAEKHAKETIQKYTAIRNRLQAYYMDVQERINKLYPETFKGQEGQLNEAHALALTNHLS